MIGGYYKTKIYFEELKDMKWADVETNKSARLIK